MKIFVCYIVIHMAIKERRTKILLALYLLSDVDLTSVLLNEKTQKIFDLSLNQKTRGTLSGMLKEEVVEKVGEGYKLTEKGLKELCLEFPFFRFINENKNKSAELAGYCDIFMLYLQEQLPLSMKWYAKNIL